MLGKLRLQLIDLIRGTRILSALRELEAHQYMPGEEVDMLRERRLDDLFNAARSTTKYYSGYDAFGEVPVLTKDLIRRNSPALVSNSYKGRLHRKQSGGSTGISLPYYITTESQSYLWAGILLSWRVAGYVFGDRVAFIAGSSLIKTGWPNRIFYALFNVMVYPATPINDEKIQTILASMKKNRTKIIYGYANVINELACSVKKLGPGYLPDLKGIVCTAEILNDKVRKNIAESFGVPVYNQYGCNEGGAAAFECERGKLHLISSRIAYEVNPDDGCLISTDLANRGFIMLKYDTGDLLEFAEQPCGCGRTFPAIDRIVGRSSDIVVDRHHNRLHDSFFYFLFKHEPSVKKYQAVFTDHIITLTLQTDHSKGPHEYEEYMTSLKEQVTFNEYRLVLNGPFVLLRNGKHKQIVDRRAAVIDPAPKLSEVRETC